MSLTFSMLHDLSLHEPTSIKTTETSIEASTTQVCHHLLACAEDNLLVLDPMTPTVSLWLNSFGKIVDISFSEQRLSILGIIGCNRYLKIKP